MAQQFRVGDKVYALFPGMELHGVKGWLSAWYNATVIRIDADGDYVVRWNVDREKFSKLPIDSTVNEDEIKRLANKR